MKRLGTSVVEAMLLEFTPREVVKRFSDPVWFQALGCVLGFDWHSSGLTTVVCGALKEGLNPRTHEWGLYIAGGKGAASRNTPRELAEFADEHAPSLPVQNLQHRSRLAAQVDNAALQDGHTLYHHTFIVTDGGDWTIVQQGLNEETGWARRYHWLGENLQSMVEEPHAGICSRNSTEPLNLVARQSRENRNLSVEIAAEDPLGTLTEFKRLSEHWKGTSKHLDLPARHDLPDTVSFERSLRILYDRPANSFEDLLDTEKIGPKTVRALSMIAEVVWGAQPSYDDPARYSFAHGGKDGHPYPIERQEYKKSIRLLRSAVREAKLDRSEKMKAMERLSCLHRRIKTTPTSRASDRPSSYVSNHETGPAGESRSNAQSEEQLSLPLKTPDAQAGS